MERHNDFDVKQLLRIFKFERDKHVCSTYYIACYEYSLTIVFT